MFATLHQIKTELDSIEKMIGIVKSTAIVEQLLYFAKTAYQRHNNQDYKHTVLYGPQVLGKPKSPN